jgi:hypothetical protein
MYAFSVKTNFMKLFLKNVGAKVKKPKFSKNCKFL